MEYIRVTNDNIEKEHICCAISNNKDIQVYRFFHIRIISHQYCHFLSAFK